MRREQQGEGIIVSDREPAMFRGAFSSVATHEMNLLAMGKRFFRRRLHRPWALSIVGMAEACDSMLAALPVRKRYCGEGLIVATT